MTRITVIFLFISWTLHTHTCIAHTNNWIDPDTPQSATSTKSLVKDNNDRSIISPVFESNSHVVNQTLAENGKVYDLIMSDEFNAPGRSFNDGHDPKWTAIDKNDYTNGALHYYSPSNVRTNENGDLEIKTEAKDVNVAGFDDVKLKKTKLTKHFTSGMLQSWNKFCFTGGIVEAEVELPGWHDVGGLWPAFWLLGNLARHTFVGSSSHIWPFSATECNSITKEAQAINACGATNHYDLTKGVGRGAPEIDIFEVQPGSSPKGTGAFLEMFVGQPFMSASYQVAPGRIVRPENGHWPAPWQWYQGMKHGNDTCLNILFYGDYNSFEKSLTPEQNYWSDAISYNRQLGSSQFSKKHVYRVEWGLPKGEKKQNGEEDSGGNTEGEDKDKENGFERGYLNWFLDGELILSMNGTSIEEAGLGSEIASEPMSILLNTAVATQWGFPSTTDCEKLGCPCENYDCNSNKWEDTCGFNPGFCDMIDQKPTMKVNYVRVYQDVTDEAQKVGCSTDDRPTRRYIKANEKWYKREQDMQPLLDVQEGRGQCDPKLAHTSSAITSDTCGGSKRGKCTIGRVCECFKDWTGPHCLVPDSSNPVEYDEPDSILDLEASFGPPKFISFKLLWIGLVVLTMFMFLAVVVDKTKNARKKGWSSIPEVEKNSMKLMYG